MVQPPFPVLFTALHCYLCAWWKKPEGFPRLESDGFSAPFPDVVVESFHLFQKGDPFWHHHVNRKSSALPPFQIPAPFRVGWWGGQGVLRGHMTPSYWRCFPRSIFLQSPCRTWRDVVASQWMLLSQILSTDPLSGTGRLAVTLWNFYLLSHRLRWCSFVRVLGFSGSFRSRAVVIGGSPSLVGNQSDYVEVQTHGRPVPGSPLWSFWLPGGRAVFLQSSMQCNLHFHWLFGEYQLETLSLVLRQSRVGVVLAPGSTQVIPWFCLLSLPFCSVLLVVLTTG